MLRQTNYGVWVDDDGHLNENEEAINYVVKCANENGIEVIPGETALSFKFIAKVMKKMNERIERYEAEAVGVEEENG